MKSNDYGDGVTVSSTVVILPESPLPEAALSRPKTLAVDVRYREAHEAGYRRWRRWWRRWSQAEGHPASLGPSSDQDRSVDSAWPVERADTMSTTLACDEECAISYRGSLNEKVHEEDERPKKRVLVSLCKSLMLYGAPCHRIEQLLDQAARSLDMQATFLFIPGVMMVCFDQAQPQTLLVRCPQGFDMGKLARVNEVANQICKGRAGLQECMDQLETIFKSPPTWGPYTMLVAHTTSSLLTVPVLFNGSLIDTALGGILGLIVGVLSLLAERYASFCNLFEIFTTILVAIIAKALDQWVCFTGVILSATAIMLPGYTLTMSIMELSARHIITGTIRFVYSLIYALFIGYGLEIGTSIYDAIDPASSQSDLDTCSGTVPHWLNVALFPLVGISMAMTLGATVRQWPSMVCCSAIGFGTSTIMSRVITNHQIIGTVSAFSVGLFGNLYLKITGELALVPLSCGIVSLVPGSVGIQGAYFLIRQDDQGISLAIQMVVASLSIAVGLFAATLIVYPTGKKRCVYLSY